MLPSPVSASFATRKTYLWWFECVLHCNGFGGMIEDDNIECGSIESRVGRDSQYNDRTLNNNELSLTLLFCRHEMEVREKREKREERKRGNSGRREELLFTLEK